MSTQLCDSTSPFGRSQGKPGSCIEHNHATTRPPARASYFVEQLMLENTNLRHLAHAIAAEHRDMFAQCVRNEKLIGHLLKHSVAFGNTYRINQALERYDAQYRAIGRLGGQAGAQPPPITASALDEAASAGDDDYSPVLGALVNGRAIPHPIISLAVAHMQMESALRDLPEELYVRDDVPSAAGLRSLHRKHAADALRLGAASSSAPAYTYMQDSVSAEPFSISLNMSEESRRYLEAPNGLRQTRSMPILAKPRGGFFATEEARVDLVLPIESLIERGFSLESVASDPEHLTRTATEVSLVLSKSGVLADIASKVLEGVSRETSRCVLNVEFPSGTTTPDSSRSVSLCVAPLIGSVPGKWESERGWEYVRSQEPFIPCYVHAHAARAGQHSLTIPLTFQHRLRRRPLEGEAA